MKGSKLTPDEEVVGFYLMKVLGINFGQVTENDIVFMMNCYMVEKTTNQEFASVSSESDKPLTEFDKRMQVHGGLHKLTSVANAYRTI